LVYLIRHPMPAVAAGICYGRLDLPLASSASRDIDLVVRTIDQLATVWSSPATRCRELAVAVASAQGAALMEDPRLQELDFGCWEGLAWSAVPRADLDRWAAQVWNYAPGGGESLGELWRRVEAFAAQARLEEYRNAGSDVLVVAHHGPLRVLHCLGQGWGASRYFEAEFPFGADGLRTWPESPGGIRRNPVIPVPGADP
jgi:alpha-ribazole phosphatase